MKTYDGPGCAEMTNRPESLRSSEVAPELVSITVTDCEARSFSSDYRVAAAHLLRELGSAFEVLVRDVRTQTARLLVILRIPGSMANFEMMYNGA